VGEIEALRALVPAVRARLPDHGLLVSALTRTGVGVAAQVPGVDATMYFPLDAGPVVRHVLDAIRPRVFAFSETEIWPAFLSECAHRGVPCVMLSGRVSERAARRYAWVRPLLGPALASVTACVQSEADAARLRALGVPAARVHVTGSLKTDVAVDAALLARVLAVWRRVGVSGRVLLVGASTHAGEEEALLAAFETVRERVPEIRLLLAPRHPERFETVARLLDGRVRAWIRFSAIEEGRTPNEGEERIVLLDRIGVLRPCFRLARAAFVGGSLSPIGGHNVLEPAAEGCVVIFGSHVDNVGPAAQALLAAGGAVQVADAGDLVRAVERLVCDVAAAAAYGARARAVVEAHRGAVTRHLEVLLAAIGSEDREPLCEALA
jgi:3-deoxy-D-manno-octulosonic-acid transferase